MRLIEINRDFEDILNNNKILPEIEKFYGGNIIRIRNFNSLNTILKVLESASLNLGNVNAIKASFDKHALEGQSYIDIPVAEYNQLNNQFNAISAHAVQYHSFISALMKVQGLDSEQLPQIINVKLPKDIDSFSELNEFNGRMEKIFKRFNVDGGVEFQGFDRGSCWYEILVQGAGISYLTLIGGISIAQKLITLRKTYYESGTAKIEYQNALDAMDSKRKLTEEDIQKYIEKAVERKLKEEVSSLFENIDLSKLPQSKPQVVNQIVLATRELAKEISEIGTEFHLSLNPPKYVEEIEGRLDIDYNQIVFENPESEVNELPSGEEE